MKATPRAAPWRTWRMRSSYAAISANDGHAAMTRAAALSASLPQRSRRPYRRAISLPAGRVPSSARLASTHRHTSRCSSRVDTAPLLDLARGTISRAVWSTAGPVVGVGRTRTTVSVAGLPHTRRGHPRQTHRSAGWVLGCSHPALSAQGTTGYRSGHRVRSSSRGRSSSGRS